MLPRPILFVFGILSLLPALRAQQVDALDPHVNVCMRAIGHAVLLKVGDPTSLVLPIEREADYYRIPFAAEFGIVPEVLAATIDSVMKLTRLSQNYVVEVVRCGTGEVVHSYERGTADTLNIMPCLSRALPSACYSIRINLLDAGTQAAEQKAGMPIVGPSVSTGRYGLILGGGIVFLLALLAFMFYRKKAASAIATHGDAVLIGAFQFDKGKLELSIRDRKVELTGKEADLLHLLHTSANETVAREVMLKEVWGNESDYVGRTLDVFVSKLRKKLEADPNVRIANIRGVGYRLILNN